MIQSQCPHCGQRVGIKSEYLGKRVRCAKCRQPFEAKADEDAEIVDAEAASPSAPTVELPARRDQFADSPVARRAAVRPDPPSQETRRFEREENRPRRREEPARGVSLWLALGIPLLLIAIAGAVLAVVWISSHRPDNAIAAGPEPGEKDDRPVDPPKEMKPAPEVARLQALSIEANAMVYDRHRAQLYVAVSNKAVKDANKILAIDPATGVTVWSVNVASDPNVLALSDNGAVLWIGLKGASAIQRLDLNTCAVGPLLDLGKGSFGPTYVEQMVVLPGTTDAVAIALQRPGFSPRHDGVAIYDNGVKRFRKTQDHTGSNRIVATERRDLLIGYNNETTEFGLRRLRVQLDGVTEERPVFERVIEGFGVDIVFADGRIWATNGAVVDINTMTRVGTIPAKGAVAVDVTNKRAYYLDPEKRVIEAFTTDTLARVGSRGIEGAEPATGLVNLGGAALAYRSGRQVYIVPMREIR